MTQRAKSSSSSNRRKKRGAKRKKTRTSASDGDADASMSAAGSGEEDFSMLSTAASPTELANAQNLKKKIRLWTITTSFDITFRDRLSSEEKRKLLNRIEDNTNALAIRRHLASVYLATLADRDPSNINICDQTFLNQLFTRLSGQGFHSTAKSVFESHPDAYLERHTLPNDVQQTLFDMPKRRRDTMCMEIMNTINRAVCDSLQLRATAHMTRALEKALWPFCGPVE